MEVVISPEFIFKGGQQSHLSLEISFFLLFFMATKDFVELFEFRAEEYTIVAHRHILYFRFICSSA